VDVSAQAARRFLVTRHLLAPARSLSGAHQAVLEVFRRLGSVQFDPLAVAGRNHDLVLHARVADYDPAWCDELLYGRRELFEAYNKSLSLLPTGELPWYRTSLGVNAPRILAEHAEVAERVLERIRAEGPLSTLDFERGPAIDWAWAPTNVVRAVLEACTVTGVLGLARRQGNRRYYDLVERLFPGDLLARQVPLRDQLRHRLLSRFRAHGLLGVGGSGELWLHLGSARPDPRRPEHPGRSELHRELVEDGELVPVEVEGVRGRRFVLGEKLGLLAAPSEPPPSVAFLAPSTPSSGTVSCCGRCSTSTTSGRSTSPRPSGGGATTCSRSCSATASSAGSSRGSTGPPASCRCSACGGRTGSAPAPRTASSTPCGPPCGPISPSPVTPRPAMPVRLFHPGMSG
jgi:uncharacterized protein YcaQ